MPMTATKRYRGTALTVTWAKTSPATATAITIGGVKSCKLDAGISVKKESADGDIFPTVAFNDYQDPTIAMETIDPYAVQAITPDLRGTLSYQIADVNNGVQVGGFGRQYVITNVFLMGDNIDHTYRDFGKASLSWGMISTDGTTSPITLSTL